MQNLQWIRSHLALIAPIFLFIITLTIIPPLHALERITETTARCNGLYHNKCVIQFLPSHPTFSSNTNPKTLYFEEKITLGATFGNITVMGNDPARREQCSLVTTVQSSYLLIKLPFEYVFRINSNTILPKDQWGKVYQQTPRAVDCLIQFQPNTPLFSEPFTVQSRVTTLDMTQLKNNIFTGSTTYGVIQFPALLYDPLPDRQITFLSHENCLNQTSSVCQGDLEALPISIFNLGLRTTHTIQLSTTNTPLCPIIMTKDPSSGTNMNHYTLSLPQPSISTSAITVDCRNLIIQKSTSLSGLLITKPHVSSAESIIYESLNDIRYLDISPMPLNDCIDARDSRCTLLFIFPFPKNSTQLHEISDMVIQIAYLNVPNGTSSDTIPQNAANYPLLPPAQQAATQSWLSYIYSLEASHQTQCEDNPAYVSQLLSHPNNHVHCHVYRKSVQTRNPDLTNSSGQIQLLKVTFFGRYLLGQYKLIQFTPFTSQITSTILTVAPPPRYTTPIEVIWDHKACVDPRTQHCIARFRSRHVGGRLEIKLNPRSHFLKHHGIARVSCNSLNIGFDLESHLISLPSQALPQHLTRHRGIGDVKMVSLRDPLNVTHVLDYHECVVYYNIPYSSDLHYSYNDGTNVILDSSDPAIRTNFLREDVNASIQDIIGNYMREHGSTETPLPLTMDTPATIAYFSWPNLTAEVIAKILPPGSQLPTLWDHTCASGCEYALEIPNLKNFIVVQTYFEDTLVPRPGSYITPPNMHACIHIPVFATEITIATLPILNFTGRPQYLYTLTFSPLLTRYESMFVDILAEPICQDPNEPYCTINITYPSYNWLVGNGYTDNFVNSFTIFFEGPSSTQIMLGDYNVQFGHPLHNSSFSIIPSIWNWDELYTIAGISARHPTRMEDHNPLTASTFYVDVPQFDPLKKQYIVWDMELLQQGDPLRENPDEKLTITLTYRKFIEFYFNKQNNGVFPYLLAFGTTTGTNVIKPNYILSQPTSFSLMDLTSQFQPDYAVEFDLQCTDPYSSQCRVLVHRRQAVDEMFYYTINLWSFFDDDGVTLPPHEFNTAVNHTTFNSTTNRDEVTLTPIFNASMIAGFGDIVPLIFPLRPKDPTSTSATVQVVQFEPSDLPVAQKTVKQVYGFVGDFFYEHPPAPELGQDCLLEYNPDCTINYTIYRPVLPPASYNTPFVVAKHDLITGEHFYVDESLRLNTAEEPGYLWKAKLPLSQFYVTVDGQFSQELTRKASATVYGTTGPDVQTLPLRIKIEISHENQGILMWFAGPSDTSLIKFVVKMAKTNAYLNHIISVPPMTYMSIDVKSVTSPIRNIQNIVFPSGIGFRPVHLKPHPECLVGSKSFHSYSCPVSITINATPQNPLYDATLILRPSAPIHPMIMPFIHYFHSIRTPTAVTSLTPELREYYRPWECGNLTQIQLHFNTTQPYEDFQDTPEIIRVFFSLIFNEGYHNKTSTCNLIIQPAKDLRISHMYHKSLLDGSHPYLTNEMDLYVAQKFNFVFDRNKRYWLPPLSFYHFTDSAMLQINDDNIMKLPYPPGFTQGDFENQFLTKLREEKAVYDTAPSSDIPSFHIRITLEQMVGGPLFNVIYASRKKNSVSYNWAQSLLYSSKHNPTIDPFNATIPLELQFIPKYLKSADAQQYIFHVLNFTTHVIDFTMHSNLGFDDHHFPCIELPGNSLDRAMNLTDYLMFTSLVSQANSPTDRVTVSTANFTITPPQGLLQSLHQNEHGEYEQVNVLGLFRYHHFTDMTTMFIHPQYLSSQFPQTEASSLVTARIIRRRRSEYLEAQLATGPKPTIRGKSCYFYAPHTSIYPSNIHIKHTCTLWVPQEMMTTSDENEFFDAYMYHDHPHYSSPSAIIPIKSEHIPDDVLVYYDFDTSNTNPLFFYFTLSILSILALFFN